MVDDNNSLGNTVLLTHACAICFNLIKVTTKHLLKYIEDKLAPDRLLDITEISVLHAINLYLAEISIC
jgi:hypothetical protein